MSKRFVVEENNIKIKEDNISIFGAEAHHINVLRHRVKDIIYINEYEIEITNMDKEIVEGKIIGKMKEKGIPSKNITLIQAYLKSDKMEYVVQKAVELGVTNIQPVLSRNCVVKLDEKDKVKKCERLNKIAKEAVEQCGRTDMVTVDNIKKLSVIDFNIFDAVLICHETSTNSLNETIRKIKEKEGLKNIAVIIGPEGGLDEEEVKNILANSNTYEISLGERILRAETASFAILSILWYEFN